MNKKLKNKLLISLLMFVLSIILLSTTNYAASFEIKAAKTTLNIGETTTATLTANDCLGQFTITSSDSGVVSVSDTSKWLENNSATVTLTAKKAGTANITLTAKNVSDTAGENDITGSKKITITVPEPKKEEPKQEEPKKEEPKQEEPKQEETKKEEQKQQTIQKSSDNTLKKIIVGGRTYNNPGTSIKADNVEADVSDIRIEAQTNDSKAKVSGTGTKELVTGTNKFTLKVTAEDGSTKTYTIRVTKLEQEDNTPNIVEEEEEKTEENKELRLELLEIEGVEIIPKFEPNVFEYSIFITNQDEVKIIAKSNIEDSNIEITGNTELKDGENIAIVRLTKDDTNIEYKIVINKTGIATLLNNNDNIIDKNEDDKKIGFVGSIIEWWNKSGMLTLLFVGILGLFSVAVAFSITVYKYSKPATNASKHLNEEKK